MPRDGTLAWREDGTMVVKVERKLNQYIVSSFTNGIDE
ncbi:hypothetical protein C7S13_3355 [Burkholderia cepacia]|nr:hypothetical protein [Burkholderia cepacia]QOH33777.1 hypothetical protein C7S14_4445 [Burkholderia cepacia]